MLGFLSRIEFLTRLLVAFPIHLLIIQKEKEYAAFREATPNRDELEEGLDQGQLDYVQDNIVKHRISFWCIAVFSAYFWSEFFVLEPATLTLILQILFSLGSALIVAWFAMSLKSLPVRYGLLGILITFAMFTLFMSFATAMPVGLLALTGNVKLTVGTSVGILALYFATMLYDFADLLNLGLEPEMNKFYRDRKVRTQS